MEDDKTLSERIITSADALRQWKEMEPLATEMTSLVEEYGAVIDGIGKVFAIVGFFWDIYSNMEKAKQDAAQQQAMVDQITRAVDGMISQAVADINHHSDQQEIGEVVSAVDAVQRGFRSDVLPHAKTYPLEGFDTVALDGLILRARDVIERLHGLIKARAETGDGAAIIILYRNLCAVVQCKLTMDRWRHGLTKGVVETAEEETSRIVGVYYHVFSGLYRMSDLSFSQGIAKFEVGGHGRPKFVKYSYYHMGKSQPVYGSNMAPVSKAFIEAREAARNQVVPLEVQEWPKQAFETVKQLREMKETVPA